MGESIVEYDSALRRLATHCNFGNYLEDALRDHFVCGPRNEAMQKRLLSEADLTLANAALGMEAADRNTRSFKGTETAIKKLHSQQNHVRGKTQACYRCREKWPCSPGM